MALIGFVSGTNGNDNLRGIGAESYHIYGLAGNDTVQGGEYGDLIYGGAGNDVLYAGTGDWEPKGDRIYGEAGFDSITGSKNDDSLYGGDDGDSLAGGLGNDLIDGGYGNDTIFLGNGYDQVAGGVGTDRFDFTQTIGRSYTLIYDLGFNETIVVKSNSRLYWKYYDTGAGNAGIQIGVDLANTSNDDTIYLQNRTDLSNINFIGAVSIQQV
jgi:Ca2+-binding RTX toxin-like protein